MTGRSISDLNPIPGFNLDDITNGHSRAETPDDARREDNEYRAPTLRQHAALARNPENARAAEELAFLLDYGDGESPQSMASKLNARGQRETIFGHILRLLASTNLYVATVHLEPARQELPGDRLNELNPRSESDALRAALNEVGIGELDGGVILFQDVEHEAGTDTWRGGKHGLVFGSKVEAFERLRDTRNYRPRLQDGNTRHTSRIRIIRNITNLAYHLTYLFKGSIYGRWEGLIDGKRVRSRKRRIQGYRHSQALLWLHNQSLDDLVQLIGVRVGKDGLFFTNEEVG